MTAALAIPVNVLNIPLIIIEQSLDKTLETFTELQRSRYVFTQQIEQIFIEPIQNFLETQILPLKKLQKEYNGVKNNHEWYLNKYMLKKIGDNGVEEVFLNFFRVFKFLL